MSSPMAKRKTYTTLSENGPFLPKGHYKIAKNFPAHYIWLPSTQGGVALTSSSPLQQLRQKLSLALNEMMVNPALNATPLPFLEDVSISYTELLRLGHLESVDSAAIAKLISILGVSQPRPIMRAVSRYMAIFAGQYVKKSLPPHPNASADLIGYYYTTAQPEMFVKLWEWLRQQDGRYISTKVYAEALRCLLRLGRPLSVCEDLYNEALKRCSNESNWGLLIPGAMIPKNLQTLRNLSHDRQLCYQMFEARVRRGDWRNAYLQLDTILRMWPDSPPTEILKTAVKGRPAHECYQVYFLYCHGRPNVRPRDIHTLLGIMTRAQASSADLSMNLDLIRASFGALLAGVKTRSIAKLDERALQSLIRGSLWLLRNVIPFQQIHEDEVNRVVIDFLDYLIEWFLAWGVASIESVITSVTYVSGQLKSIALFEWAQKKMSEAESAVNDIHYMCTLAAGGEFEDAQMIKTAWKCMLGYRQRLELDTYPTDWKVFAKAARRTGLVPYYNEQVHLLEKKGSLGAKVAKQAKFPMWRSLAKNTMKSTPPISDASVWREVESFFQETTILLRDAHPANMKGFKDISMIKPSIWQWPCRVPQEWQRKLYDEMSQSSSIILTGTSGDPRSGKSPLGEPLDELRYKHWKSINSLLLQAEAFEVRPTRCTDPLGERSISHPNSGKIFEDGSIRTDHFPWLLEHLEDIEKEGTKCYTEQEWREKILNLRGHDYQPPRYDET